MSSNPLPLRPHHGMCMAYFIGLGYSDAFSAHMAGLLEELTGDSPVCLTVGTDAVCGPCPNNDGGTCGKPELVAGYDRAVLELCGLGEGYILSFGDFTALVQERILDQGIRREICGGCQWDGICSVQPSRWGINFSPSARGSCVTFPPREK